MKANCQKVYFEKTLQNLPYQMRVFASDEGESQAALVLLEGHLVVVLHLGVVVVVEDFSGHSPNKLGWEFQRVLISRMWKSKLCTVFKMLQKCLQSWRIYFCLNDNKIIKFCFWKDAFL